MTASRVKKKTSSRTVPLYRQKPAGGRQLRKVKQSAKPARRGPVRRGKIAEDSPCAPSPLTVVDLFCGAGGISEGFRSAGFRILGGIDIDPDAIATFGHNFSGAEAICGDLRNPTVHKHIVAMAKRADVIVGGPPCQAFSQVRNHSRLMEDPRNSLYREFIRVLGEATPRAFLLENVTGMDQMGVRGQIAEDLALGGEYLVRSQVVDAADFGVPQTRKRLLFFGCHRRLSVEPPLLQGSGATAALALARRNGVLPAHYEVEHLCPLWSGALAEVLSDPRNLRGVTVSQAISDLRDLPVGNRRDELLYSELPAPESAYQALMRHEAGGIVHNTQVPRINADTALRLRSIPQGGNHRDLSEPMLERYLTGQRWGQDNGSGVLSRRHFYAYRKLHPEIWAWTLNTKADSAYHYSANRALSVREFARLQSFPDRFVVTNDRRKGSLPGRIDGGAAHSRYRQIGNAVPPLLAAAAAHSLNQLFAPLQDAGIGLA